MKTVLPGFRLPDFDLALDHLQLRGDAFERLPRVGPAVQVRGDDLVDKRAARVARRNDPAGRPEPVGRRTDPGTRMRAVSSRELLAIGKLDKKLLDALVIERLARLIEHTH